jgi:hypothetical protein
LIFFASASGAATIYAKILEAMTPRYYGLAAFSLINLPAHFLEIFAHLRDAFGLRLFDRRIQLCRIDTDIMRFARLRTRSHLDKTVAIFECGDDPWKKRGKKSAKLSFARIAETEPHGLRALTQIARIGKVTVFGHDYSLGRSSVIPDLLIRRVHQTAVGNMFGFIAGGDQKPCEVRRKLRVNEESHYSAACIIR